MVKQIDTSKHYNFSTFFSGVFKLQFFFEIINIKFENVEFKGYFFYLCFERFCSTREWSSTGTLILQVDSKLSKPFMSPSCKKFEYYNNIISQAFFTKATLPPNVTTFLMINEPQTLNPS